MDSRKTACFVAAGFIGLSLTASATHAFAQPPREVVVEGPRFDPELQRTVSYKDLNLAAKADQRVLGQRISRTASDLCFDLNGYFGRMGCKDKAVHSTDDQVARAIARAERQMAGLPVGPAIAISIIAGD